MEKYNIIREIGRGNFGVVSEIMRKSDKKKLIWKELNYENIPEKEIEFITNEINILKELDHPNIVKQYEVINDNINSKIYIVMEYCEGGDLDKLILKNKNQKKLLDENLIWDIIIQSLNALNYLHNKKKVLHRDIKPSNIFLDKNYNIKLGDFGMSRYFIGYANTILGTPLYMSPEILEGIQYNEKADIWALGCTIYELITFNPAYEANYINDIKIKVKNLPKRINVNYSDNLWKFITKMLIYDYKHRPSTLELINNYKEFKVLKDIQNIKDKWKELILYENSLKKKDKEQKKKENELKEKTRFLNEKENKIKKIQNAQIEKENELIKKEKFLKKKEEFLNKREKIINSRDNSKDNKIKINNNKIKINNNKIKINNNNNILFNKDLNNNISNLNNNNLNSNNIKLNNNKNELNNINLINNQENLNNKLNININNFNNNHDNQNNNNFTLNIIKKCVNNKINNNNKKNEENNNKINLNHYEHEDKITNYLLYKNNKIFPKIGLKNSSDISYLNAVLLVLGNIEELLNYFLKPKNITIINNKKDKMPLAFAVKELFLHLYPKENEDFNDYNPSQILEALSINNKNFNKLKNNPNKLIIELLNKLSLELNKKECKEELNCNQFDLHDTIKNGAKHFINSNDSIIFNLFNWFKIEEFSCTSCKEKIYNLKTFNNFRLDIFEYYKQLTLNNGNNIITIDECLKFQLSKKRKELFCKNCQNFNYIENFNEIFSSPNIFLFSLNRGIDFNENNEYFEIPFKIEDKLNLNNFIKDKKFPLNYELIGIVSISINDKKYIAMCKSSIDNKWYYFNDEKVELIEHNNVIDLNNNIKYYIPCILIYKAIKINNI